MGWESVSCRPGWHLFLRGTKGARSLKIARFIIHLFLYPPLIHTPLPPQLLRPLPLHNCHHHHYHLITTDTTTTNPATTNPTTTTTTTNIAYCLLPNSVGSLQSNADMNFGGHRGCGFSELVARSSLFAKVSGCRAILRFKGPLLLSSALFGECAWQW